MQKRDVRPSPTPEGDDSVWMCEPPSRVHEAKDVAVSFTIKQAIPHDSIRGGGGGGSPHARYIGLNFDQRLT